MKNISRRVFIKGMAVAAVATAASTVLAGCNVPGNTTDGTPVTGFQSETKTLTIGEEKVTITTTGCNYKANGNLQVDLTVVNDADEDITLTEKQDNVADHEVAAGVYFDGQYGKRVGGDYFAFGSDTFTGWTSEVEVAKNATGVANSYKTSIVIGKDAIPEEWDVLTVAFIMNIKDDASKDQKTEVVFNIRK